MARIPTANRPRRPRERIGVVSVEFALVFPLLALLVFGTLEMGFTFGDWMVLSEAVRTGARAASLGKTTDAVCAAVLAHAPGIVPEQLTITCEYRTWTDPSWGSWQSLADSAGANTANPADEIRVTVSYQHSLLAGPLLSDLAGGTRHESFTLQCAGTTRRE